MSYSDELVPYKLYIFSLDQTVFLLLVKSLIRIAVWHSLCVIGAKIPKMGLSRRTYNARIQKADKLESDNLNVFQRASSEIDWCKFFCILIGSFSFISFHTVYAIFFMPKYPKAISIAFLLIASKLLSLKPDSSAHIRS